MADLFKDVMPSLMQTKKDVFENDIEKNDFFDKNSYIINKTLSMYVDCVMPANEMNMYYFIDGKLKHDYFINMIRSYKRSFHYSKSKKLTDLEVIKEYYGVGNNTARQYHNLLTSEQLEQLKKRLDKGGVITQRRP